MYKILIPEDISQKGKDLLKSNGYDIKVLANHDVDTICKEAVNADAIIARTTAYPARIFDNVKKLKIIVRYGAGYDNIDIDAATNAGVMVCNTPTANSNSVAEHAVGLMLACASNLLIQDSQNRMGNWDIRNTKKRTELKGKVFGLIGGGNIGRLTAEKVHLGLGMKVIAYDAYAKPSLLPQYIELKTSIEEIFTMADVVSLHIPANSETRNSIGLRLIQKMKPSAYLINCARGGIVKEDELFQCLKNGVIAGAGIDVYEQEPTASSNPLFTLENVIATPHSAALTFEAMEQMSLDCALEIERVFSGQAPKWPVNMIG